MLHFGRHMARQTRAQATASTGGAAAALSSRAPRLTLVGGATMAMFVWTVPQLAACAADEDEEAADADADSSLSTPSGKPDEMERFLNLTVLPMCNKLGFGGVMGFCSGVAARSIGEHVVYWAGIAFTAVQIAQYNGYIDVDWYKVKDQGACHCSALPCSAPPPHAHTYIYVYITRRRLL